MRTLVVGSGGREHALVWTLARSPLVEEVVVAPGNPGMERLASRRAVAEGDIRGIAGLARTERFDLVVVGPEAPLVAGLADALRADGIGVFGPSADGARIEGSKAYAKRLMRSKGIPTAEARDFEELDEALAYIDKKAAPMVVKADGLAAGKGVRVCATVTEARDAVREMIEGGRFGQAGKRVVIEDHMVGRELSILALCDGHTIAPMEAARDYKRALDGDRGANTGGMGSYSPVADATPQDIERVIDEILEPVAKSLAEDAAPYVGVIYAGLMLTPEGPRVVEFNCRLGDPEAQALLPRLETDLAEAMVACLEGRLDQIKLRFRPEACVCVMAASEGYPNDYETGRVITGLDAAEGTGGVVVFHSGTARRDGELVTSGGRVLGVSALGDEVERARDLAYAALAKVHFEGMHFRRDIAVQKGAG